MLNISLLLKQDLVVDHSAVFDQPLMSEGCWNAQLVTVTSEVVKLRHDNSRRGGQQQSSTEMERRHQSAADTGSEWGRAVLC